MNIFRTIASGKHAFREEFVSAFLAYLLSHKMDHGLGYTFLSRLLNHIADQNQANQLKELAAHFKSRLWENVFDDNGNQPVVELEFNYPGGFIDIVIKCENWFIMIENKILQASKKTNQIKEQYKGMQEVLRNKGFLDDCQILVIYLVPASQNGGGWTVSPSFFEELDKVKLRDGDHKALISWQPATSEESDTVSVVSIIREMMRDESEGLMAPISTVVRHALLSLVDFAMGEFQGFHYEKATSKKNSEPKTTVAEVLSLSGDYFVGIQYGKAGILSRAWKNKEFIKTEVTLTEDDTRGWQYVPLNDFVALTKWCFEPETHSLEVLSWTGSPFATEGLYRVAKYGKSRMYIGIRGGENALRSLSPEQIDARTVWQLNMQKKSSDWLTCEEFCGILEEKGLRYD